MTLSTCITAKHLCTNVAAAGVHLACLSAASSDDFKHIMEALLKPISKACLERLSQTRCASQMNRDNLRDVRRAFRIVLQIKDHDAESGAFVKEEESW